MNKAKDFWKRMLNQAPYTSAGLLPPLLLLLWHPAFVFVGWGVFFAILHVAIELILWRWAYFFCFPFLLFFGTSFGRVAKIAGMADSPFSSEFFYFVMFLGTYLGLRGLLHLTFRPFLLSRAELSAAPT